MSIEVEVAQRLGDGLFFRLAKRFLEAACQRIATRLLGLNGLFEQRLAAAGLVGENPRRFAELRLVAALGLLVRDDPPEVGVNDQDCAAAGTLELELALQLRQTNYSSWWLLVSGGSRGLRN